MAFNNKPQVYSASINALTLGTEGKEVTLGGENVYPLYSFDGEMGNPARIGALISDRGYVKEIPGLNTFFEGCETVPEMAARLASQTEADFICLTLDSADPNGENTSVEEEVQLAQAVYDAISKPLVISGCHNIEKDSVLFDAIAAAMQGKNILLLSAREEDYKNIGASAGLAYGQCVGAESAVDINLAKQLNVLMTQLGVPAERMAMNLGSAAVGYGFEYLASTIERVKLAALSQNDAMLQMPVITNVGDDAWSVKEALLEEADEPAWGSREERGIQMEISSAAATLASGSDCVMLRHPESIHTIAGLIAGLD